jgi:apolipoprotein N-acyltransferase
VLLQPNISQTEEFSPESLDAMLGRLSYVSLRAALSAGGNPPTMIVWPEVPAPFHFDRDHRFRAELIDVARVSRAYLLAGVVAHTPAGEPLNSAVLLDPAGNFVDRYDKMFLVPFGEFVPPLFGFVNRITNEAGDFEAGKRLVVFPVRRRGVGTFICYESVFPHLVRRFAEAGAQVFVNISNDGYFGRSAAREQHLKIVRMRAIENRRWILRPTNDGLTVVIDPAGRVIERQAPFERAALRGHFSYETGLTVYTRYGDWFVWLCALIAVAALIGTQAPRYRRQEYKGFKKTRGT